MPDPVLRVHRGVYIAQWTENGKRIRRSLGTDDKEEAKRRLAHLALTEAVLDRNTQKTVSELYEKYIIEKESEGKQTVRAKASWKYLSPVFGFTYPQYITPESVKKYIESRSVSSGTLRTEVGLLRTICNFAYKHRLIPNAIYIPLPSKPRPRTDYLTREQFRSLLEAASRPHLSLFLILAITTGARSNAILDLTWDRVDLSKRTIDLRLTGTATNKGRAVVPINDTALRYLTEAYPLRRSEYVIEWCGRPVTQIRAAVRFAGKRIGLHVSPHMLRHSAAVWMAEGGVPMSEIAQYLGHSNTAITERVYARFSPGYLRKAASLLEIE